MSTIKRVTAIICIVLMLAGVAAGCTKPATTQPTAQPATQAPTKTDAAPATTAPSAPPKLEGEIVIGACSDLSGQGASNGQGEQQAYQMIAEEINAAGGVLGKKLVIHQEDTNGTVEGSVNALNRQLANKETVAVLGYMYSSQVLGIADIVLQAKKPLMYGGSSPSISKLNNPYLFRMRPADDFVMVIVMNWLMKNWKPNKIGFLYSNDDFGTQGYNVAVQYLKDHPEISTTIVSDGYPNGTKDFYSQLLKIKDEKCDCMIWWGHDEEEAIITRQRIELDMKAMPVFSSSGMGNSIYKKLVTAEECDGIIAIAESADVGNNWAPYTEFAKKYEAKFGIIPNNNVVSLGPAIYLLCDAIKRAGTTESEALCKALRETKDFASLSGYLTCDSQQNLNHNSIIYKMKDMQRVFMELYSVK